MWKLNFDIKAQFCWKSFNQDCSKIYNSFAVISNVPTIYVYCITVEMTITDDDKTYFLSQYIV